MITKNVLRGTAVLLIVLAAGCSDTPPSAQQPPPGVPAPTVVPFFVPDLLGTRYDKAQVKMQQALLVPVLRFAPELTTSAGAVVATEPKPGTVAKAGDVIVLVVAGRPAAPDGEGPLGARALSELAELDRVSLVGVGWDRYKKELVVSFAPGVDVDGWRARIAALARGERYRIQSCKYTYAELRTLQEQFTERTFLPRAAKMAFGMSVDYVTCSVALSADLTPAEITELRDRYGDRVTVATGGPPKRG